MQSVIQTRFMQVAPASHGGDLNTGADLGSIITAKMAGLTDPGAALDLFSLGGTNGGMFTASAFWDEATKYFNKSA